MGKLNEEVIKGKKMYVSMAKFEKGGHFGVEPPRQEPKQPQRRIIQQPATRDSRKYVEVVRGVKHTQENRRVNENRAKQSAVVTTGQTIRVDENGSLSERLKMAVVVEVHTRFELREAAEMVANMELPTASLSAISPNELVLFFDEEEDIEGVLNEDSMLKTIGKSIYRWDVKKFQNERTVWVECTGIHPEWWSYENTVKIGELWGQVLKVEEEIHGVNSLTAARLLLKTKISRKLDEKVGVEWGSNLGTVFIRESSTCRCMETMGLRERHYEDDDSEDDKDGESEHGDDAVEKAEQGEDDGGNVDEQNVVGVMEVHDCVDGREVGQDDMFEGGTVEVLGLERESGSTVEHSTLNINSAVDEWLVGPLSCPIEPLEDYWFDPIASLECPLSMEAAEMNARKVDGSKSSTTMVGKTPQSKRPRGRPKRSACSLPDPLSVPSTPSSCSLEAMKTWSMARRMDVATHDESEIVEELRRSKRVQIMEGNNPT
ncbi:unnamed protein product [Amaranthus hypochondriacus]